MTVATREAGATLGHRAAGLAGGCTLVAVTRLIIVAGIVGAERAVATDRSWVRFAVPRHHTAKTTRAAGETSGAANVHVSESIDEHALVSTSTNGCGGTSGGDGRSTTVLTSVFGEARDIVAESGGETGGGRNRRRSVRAQISERLGSTEVGTCGKGAGGVLEAGKVTRLLVTNSSRVVESVLIADISEIGGRGAVEASSLSLALLDSLDLRHRRTESLTRGFFVDVHSALVSLALGDVSKAHVMRNSVDDTSLGRAQVRGEDEQISVLVLLEDQQIRVNLESVRVVKIDSKSDISSRHRRWRGGRQVAGKRGHGSLGLQSLGGHRTVLLLELTATLTLFSFNPLALSCREHLLILDSQLSALEFKVVHGVDDSGSLVGRGEVGESQSTENTVVEMVVEGVGKGETHVSHQLDQLLLLDGKRNVLDDDSGGDELLIGLRSKLIRSDRRSTKNTSTEAKVWRDLGHRLGLIEPGLSTSISQTQSILMRRRAGAYRGKAVSWGLLLRATSALRSTQSADGVVSSKGGAVPVLSTHVVSTIVLVHVLVHILVHVLVHVGRSAHSVVVARSIETLLLLLLLMLIIGAIETRGQMSVRVELARRLAMQLRLVTLHMGRATRRGIVVIHVGLLKTHDVDR